MPATLTRPSTTPPATRRSKTKASKAAKWSELQSLAAEYACGAYTWVSEDNYAEARIIVYRDMENIKEFWRGSRQISMALINEAIRWFKTNANSSCDLAEHAAKTAQQASKTTASGQSFWAVNRCIVADARHKGAVPMAVARAYGSGEISYEEALTYARR